MELIEEYLHSYPGEPKILRAYIVHKNEVVAEIEGEAIYPTIHDEMIARVPHFTLDAAGVNVPDPTYLINRKKGGGKLSP